MNTYIALFRGINIGGHNKIPMKALTALLEDLGCRNVSTYIQSGNVIFSTVKRNHEKLVSDIRQTILMSYGFSPEVILLTEQELKTAIANNPFPTDSGKALHFLFLGAQPVKPDLNHLNEIKTGTEAFKLIDRVFYLYTPDGVARSKLAGNAEKSLGVTTTGRNWNTVSRLIAMLSTEN